MQLEHFKQAWQDRGDDRPAEAGPVAEDVRQRVAKLHAQVRRRDLREAAAALAVIVIFTRLLWIVRNTTARVGAGILIASAVMIVGRLYAARRRDAPRPVGLPVAEFCRAELAAVNAQIRLLRSVAWWYIAPVIVGANLVVAGLSRSAIGTVVYLAVTLAMGAVIYRLNQRAVARRLVPLRLALERSLGELQDDPTTDRGESP